MSTQAPICHIPPENPTIPQPGVRSLPAIPVATDLTSAFAAINAMRLIIQTITNQNDRDNGTQINNFQTRPDKNVTWVEDSRKTEKVKVYNPDDDSQFIEVERINQLVMKDKNTGNKWTWNR